MKKYFKAGMLIALLVVPALIFIFLKVFGKNHFALKTYYPKLTATGAPLIQGKDTVFHTIPSFNLVSQEGEKITETTFENSIYVVDFFFATCPKECPKMSSQLTRVQDAFDQNEDVKILSITVNPRHDSVPVLRDYASRYNARKDKWYMATGNKEHIYDLARNGYYVTAIEGDGGKGDFFHTQKFVLIDKNKHIRGYYNGLDPKDVDRLILEIKVLQHEGKVR